MKPKSSLLSAIGALALFVLIAFPSSSALAKAVADVDIYYEYDGPTGLQVEMEVEYPAGATIFYTLNGSNPTHSGSTPGSGTYIYYGPVYVPYMQWMHFKARAWKSGWGDSANITYLDISNPVQ